MSISNYYASIAVVEVHPDDSVTIESISVAEGECILSGAWDFRVNETLNIQNVLDGKLIIPIGDASQVRKTLGDVNAVFVDVSTFLKDARKAADEALLAYAAFKSEDPTKRKKLVAPEFYDWPSSLDFNSSAKYLESIGKLATPHGTPDSFKRTLSAARLLKHLVDMWQLDEQERTNRKYVDGDDATITILPVSWLPSSN
jgi:hypothetical protein